MKTARKFMALIIFAVFAVFVCATVTVAATSTASAETTYDAVAVYSDEGTSDAVTLAAEETTDGSSEDSATSGKAIAAAIAIGLAALGGALGMGIAIAKAMEGISRQPEAAGNIRSTMMLGLVFVETVVIYALIVSILLVFVL